MAQEIFQDVPEHQWFTQKKYINSENSPFSGTIISLEKPHEKKDTIEVRTGEFIITPLTENQIITTENLVSCLSLAFAMSGKDDSEAQLFGLAHLSTISIHELKKVIHQTLSTLPNSHTVKDVSMNIPQTLYKHFPKETLDEIFMVVEDNDVFNYQQHRIFLRQPDEVTQASVSNKDVSYFSRTKKSTIYSHMFWTKGNHVLDIIT